MDPDGRCISLLKMGIFQPAMSTLPETNSLHLKMDGWNTSFLLGCHLFRGELLVSGSVYILGCPCPGFQSPPGSHYVFRGSQPIKPSFATVAEGGQANIYSKTFSTEETSWRYEKVG